jgi:acyl carrier protein
VTAGADVTPVLRRILGRIAPEADLDALDPAADLRRALDIDSMDFLGFLAAIQAELGVVVPEADYAQVRTLAGCAAYISQAIWRRS